MIYDIGYLQNIFKKILIAEARTNEVKCLKKPTLTSMYKNKDIGKKKFQ